MSALEHWLEALCDREINGEIEVTPRRFKICAA
jgi:hypothetical protein